MSFYPFDLVLAAALAWGMIFHGRLPTRLIRAPVFIRPVGFAGIGWIIVALLSPAMILHYQLLIALVTLFAWWKLRSEDALGGKMWLAGGAGLGIALSVVLILAVTPGVFPAGQGLAHQIIFLGSVYLGGAVIGMAVVLHRFTRRSATNAGISPGMVESYARWLVLFIFASFAFQLAALPCSGSKGGFFDLTGRVLGPLIAMLIFLVLLLPAWWARRLIRSPAPSTSAVPLLAVIFLGTFAEIIALW